MNNDSLNEDSITPSFERAQWQFSLRALLATTAGVAILFALLRLMGIDPLHVSLALVGSVVGAGAAVGLIYLYWLLTGGPKIRQRRDEWILLGHRHPATEKRLAERVEMIERLAKRNEPPPNET